MQETTPPPSRVSTSHTTAKAPTMPLDTQPLNQPWESLPQTTFTSPVTVTALQAPQPLSNAAI